MKKERQAFNFYRSYWDVAMKLNDQDRLAFYDAVMNKQFTGVEPELDGMADFAYLSQKHSVDKQVKGWEDKTKQTLNPTEHPYQPPTEGPTKPPTQGPTYPRNATVMTTEPPSVGPSVQEQGQEQEKEEGQEQELEKELNRFLSLKNII